MIIKKQFNNLSHKQQLKIEYKNMYLIEEQNVTEGDFLIFSDKPLEEKVVYVNIKQQVLEDMEKRTSATEDALLALIMKGGM